MVRSLSGIELFSILAAGAIGSLALFNGSLSGSWLSLAILFATMQVLWIALRDMRDFTIPDGPVVALAMAGAILRLSSAQDAWTSELPLVVLDAGLCGAAFLLVREAFFRLRGFDGMGFGDVKLAIAAGALVGMEGFAWSVFLASAVGLVAVVVAAWIRPGLKVERLPFGALLAPVCWSVWLMQIWSAA